MLIRHTIVRTALLVSLLAVVALPTTVFAHHGTDDELGSSPTSGHGAVEASAGVNSEARLADGQADGAKTPTAINRLAGNKLKACQKRQDGINAIMARTIARSQNQLTLFDTIATRAEAFYVKQGKSVATYDTLLAAVANAKAKTETDLQALKAAPAFTCDGTDPKNAAATFKAALKTEIQDLKGYRTAVKNLIVGIKTAQATTTQEDN